MGAVAVDVVEVQVLDVMSMAVNQDQPLALLHLVDYDQCRSHEINKRLVVVGDESNIFISFEFDQAINTKQIFVPIQVIGLYQANQAANCKN